MLEKSVDTQPTVLSSPTYLLELPAQLTLFTFFQAMVTVFPMAHVSPLCTWKFLLELVKLSLEVSLLCAV